MTPGMACSPTSTGRPAVTAGVTPPTVSKWSIPSGVMWVMMNPTSSIWAEKSTFFSGALFPFLWTMRFPMLSTS